MIEKHASPTTTIEVITRDTVKTISGAHKALEDVLFELNNDEHVYLYGPAGSGKTTLAEQAATALDKDFYKSGAILSKHELIGFVDAGGAYHTTAFRTAFETGALFLFDEMDASAPEAILALNDAMSNGSYTFPDSPIALKKGDGFLAIGCANTIGKGATREYIGRAPLDGASRNRFAKLEIGYDEQLELRLGREAFKQYGGADDARQLFDTVYSEIKAVRKHIAKRKLSIILSPRDTIRCAKSMAGGKTADDVRDSVIYVEFTDDQRKAAEV
jgi:cobaltochelatase CobS